MQQSARFGIEHYSQEEFPIDASLIALYANRIELLWANHRAS